MCTKSDDITEKLWYDPMV